MIEFNLEELEMLRLILGDKLKHIKGRLAAFKNDEKISNLKKEKLIDETDEELAIVILLEAKIMRIMSERILKN